MLAIIISTVAGLIGGLFASVFAEGVRKMLAPLIIPNKICLSGISKSTPREERQFPYWYVQISVHANSFWNLLASYIDDVKASIHFFNCDTGTTMSYEGEWIDLGDALLARIGIGTELKLRIATLSNDTLKAIGSVDREDTLGNTYDIQINLKNGKKSIGRWRYKQAIVNGQIQNVGPDKELGGKCNVSP